MRTSALDRLASLHGATVGIATGAFVGERDSWPDAVARAVEEGWRVVELTAVTEPLYASLGRFLPVLGMELAVFDRVSIHAPSVLDSPPADVACSIVAAGLSYDLVFHPDVFLGVSELGDLGGRAVFENMDANKSFGRTAADVAETFRRFPAAGFCLDVAHVWTNDATLQLGFELLEAFGDRLRQVHLSGVEPDGTHRPTTDADLALYEPLLARCAGVPWVLESVPIAR